MTLQTLVSGVELNITGIADRMQLESDAIVINQTDDNSYCEYEYEGHRICCYSFAERGVGLSRNSALMRADADIILFSDEDIIYEHGYADMILRAYEEHPDADMLLFNVDVVPERATYHTDAVSRVHRWNCGRYPSYSFSCRRESIYRANVTFSLLFGGGARYSNGEDSLFIDECIKKRLRVYALPVCIGREEPRPSTWFEGYTDKFFYDRGVLYRYLYGALALPMAYRFLFRHRAVMLKERALGEAAALMKQGIREA